MGENWIKIKIRKSFNCFCCLCKHFRDLKVPIILSLNWCCNKKRHEIVKKHFFMPSSLSEVWIAILNLHKASIPYCTLLIDHLYYFWDKNLPNAPIHVTDINNFTKDPEMSSLSGTPYVSSVDPSAFIVSCTIIALSWAAVQFYLITQTK